MNKVYIYALQDPSNVSDTIYIGKTINIKERMRGHMKDVNKLKCLRKKE